MERGANIDHYQITHFLGEGGMGEVYEATDTRLGRTVAVKVLSREFVGEPDRLRRFEQEARTLATLNHPNIMTVFDVGEQEGQPYLVCERLEGHTLREELSGGPLKMRRAVHYAHQIAEGLAAAHAKGIIHRDLKPENLFVSSDGRIKILDFGLAKLKAPARTGSAGEDRGEGLQSGGDDPTKPDTAVGGESEAREATEPGRVLGTPSCMAPEQVRGGGVDHRTDIFALGCVLYEMLSGQKPFRRETAVATMAAILNDEPSDLGEIRPELPLGLVRTVHRCLEKVPEQRFQSAIDLAFALDSIVGSSSSTGNVPLQEAVETAVFPRRRFAWMAGLGILAVAVAIGLWTLDFGASTGSEREVRFSLAKNTRQYRDSRLPVLSPDGKQLAFKAYDLESGKWRLWVRELDQFQARPLPVEAESSRQLNGLFWCRDNRRIGFHKDGKLWSVRIDGSGPKFIAEVGGNLGADWNREGVIILSPFPKKSGLLKISDSGGEPEILTELNTNRMEVGHAFPHFLPDGNRFLFLGQIFDFQDSQSDQRLYAGRLDSEEVKGVGRFKSGAWFVEPNWLLFAEAGSLRAAPFDLENLKITGEAVTLARRMYYFQPESLARLSVARDGTLLFQGRRSNQQLAWVDEQGTITEVVLESGRYAGFSISPDGERIAVGLRDPRTGLSDLWLYGTERETRTHFTSHPGYEGNPVWSPDGKKIYYQWAKKERPNIYSLKVDGEGEPQLLYQASGVWTPRDVSPDDRHLILRSWESGVESLWLMPMHEDGKPELLHEGSSSYPGARFSPDGNWVAYSAEESGRAQVYLKPLSGKGRKIQVSEHGGATPRWGPEGKKLYYRALSPSLTSMSGNLGTSHRLMVVEFKEAGMYEEPDPKLLFETQKAFTSFEVEPVENRFLVKFVANSSAPIRVILNWQESAKKRLNLYGR